MRSGISAAADAVAIVGACIERARAAQAIADAGYDVLAGPPKASKGGLLYAAGTTLRRGA